MMENRVTDGEGSKNQDRGQKGALVPADTEDDMRLSKLVANKRLKKEPGYNNMRLKSASNKRSRKSVGLYEELLPGIVNDITLDLITPKLSLRDLWILPSVSRSWQQAIQSRVVYNSRVRSHSKETFALVAHNKLGAFPMLSLYSSRDDTWFKLPRNRYLSTGVLHMGGQCVVLDAELYILGGYGKGECVGSRKVHVLDLVRGRKWKKCADMLQPRQFFGCGVLDGKIYVFGGSSHGKRDCRCELYDPKDNIWSPIKPMAYGRSQHQVLTVGQEFFIHGGRTRDQPPWEPFAEVYNPWKDEWRLINPFECRLDERILTAQGKFYFLNRAGISLYNIDEQSLTNLQSYPAHAEDIDVRMIRVRTIVVDDELLALVPVFMENKGDWRLGFVRSKGLCDEKENVVWERATSAGPSAGPSTGGRPYLGALVSVEMSIWAVKI